MIPLAAHTFVVNSIFPMSFLFYILSHPWEVSIIKSEYFIWQKA